MNQNRPAKQLCGLKFMVMKRSTEPGSHLRAHESPRPRGLGSLLQNLKLTRTRWPQALLQVHRATPRAELSWCWSWIQLLLKRGSVKKGPSPSLNTINGSAHLRMLTKRRSSFMEQVDDLWQEAQKPSLFHARLTPRVLPTAPRCLDANDHHIL